MNASRYTGIALSDRLTPHQILQTIHSGISLARAAGLPDWMGAVDTLVEEAVALNACFSSGELSAYIRTYCPDLCFSITRDVGPHLRGRFQAGTFPSYAGGPVLQGSRNTLGYSSSSPAGATVHVYGPDDHSINTHLFEVCIPAPGGSLPDPAHLPAAPRQSPTPLAAVPRRRSVRAPRVPGTTARIHRDRRLCVPRWAFDQMATAMGGQRFLGGETVYVLHGTDEVRILRDAVAGAVPHRLVTSRGRLLFAARGAAPFVPGSRYSLQVSTAGIRLDLSAVAA